jgi:hypothetical protein
MSKTNNNNKTIMMNFFLLVLTMFIFNFCSLSQTRNVSETTKKIVYARDEGKCQCCGSNENLEYDHIIPYSCGGKSDDSNIQLLCLKCNRSKSNSCYCKEHNKKIGNNCCEENSNINESSNSNSTNTKSTAIQCSGTTQKGKRCRNMTTNANGRCYLH